MRDLLELQKELEMEIYEKQTAIPTKTDIAVALIVEAAKLVELCGYKWWKNENVKISKIKEETIDVFRFLLSMFNNLEMEEKEIKEIYLQTQKEV